MGCKLKTKLGYIALLYIVYVMMETFNLFCICTWLNRPGC
jgi:hypothetical protein